MTAPLTQGDFFACYLRFSPRRRPRTIETKLRLYKCALREIPRLPVCRSRGTAAARKRQNDLLSGCQNCALPWRAARRKNCRHCASVPVIQTRRNRDRMCNRITAHAQPSDYHLVRAAPRHSRQPARDTLKRHLRVSGAPVNHGDGISAGMRQKHA